MLLYNKLTDEGKLFYSADSLMFLISWGWESLDKTRFNVINVGTYLIRLIEKFIFYKRHFLRQQSTIVSPK